MKEKKELINYSGSQCVLKILKKVRMHETISEEEFKNCFHTNMFFLNFYSEVFGISYSDIKDALCKANTKDDISGNKVLNKLHDGFYIAANQIDALNLKIDALKNIHISAIQKDVLLHLPEKTEIDFEIHVTIDAFNGGFQYKNGLAYSLLTDMVNSDSFIPTIKHEMHHCGVEFWSLKDALRQIILSKKLTISIAVHFLEDLLREGLAIYFFNRDDYDKSSITYTNLDEDYKRVLDTYYNNINKLFMNSNRLLKMCFDEKQDISSCKNLYYKLTVDENARHPIGHYIGLKMVETMFKVFTEQEIMLCIKELEHFLPMYNQAAAKTNQFIFDNQILSEISKLFNNRGID